MGVTPPRGTRKEREMDEKKFNPYDTSTWEVGVVYVIDGKRFCICRNCLKVVKDGFFGGIHLCA